LIATGQRSGSFGPPRPLTTSRTPRA
jgi:hypothetical protein